MVRKKGPGFFSEHKIGVISRAMILIVVLEVVVILIVVPDCVERMTMDLCFGCLRFKSYRQYQEVYLKFNTCIKCFSVNTNNVCINFSL